MDRDNRRKNSRVSFKTTATLHFAGKTYEENETQDLSLKGIFIKGITSHNKGETCDVTLHLSGDTSDVKLRMKGQIVRTEENGIAIHFHEVDIDSFFHLKNILYYNLDNPETLDKEFADQLLLYQAID